MEDVVYGVIIAFVLMFVIRLVVVCYYGERDSEDRGAAIEEQGREHDSILRQRDMDLEIEMEEQKREIAETRLERRECYNEFLKPYTMIVKEADLINLQEQQQQQQQQSPQQIISIPNDQDPSLNKRIVSSHCCVVQIPKRRRDGHSCCTLVDPSCAMCLADYEVGDAIVWSSEPECNHAFHQECVLQWLSMGKKRCPVCRHWFVPKTLLAELKKELLANSNNNNHRSQESSQGVVVVDDFEESSSSDSAIEPLTESGAADHRDIV
jgi:hypothetical protein